MSYAAITWSYTSTEVINKKLSSTQLTVLRVLCWLYNTGPDHTRSTKNCYASIETIARLAGLKTGAVNNAKRKLEEAGLISWDRAANFGSEKRDTNEYRINCPDLEKQLRDNESDIAMQRYRAGIPVPEFDESHLPPEKPGFRYNRPDPASLMSAFASPLSEAEANWMADALEFVFDGVTDIPGRQNRDVLYELIRQAPGVEPLRKALDKVKLNDNKGRRINKRISYLKKATLNEIHSKKDPA